MSAAQLKPQDVLLALKLAAHPGQPWMQKDLSASVGVSPAEVSDGLKRLARCRLYSTAAGAVSRAGLCEFLLHGIQYVFPADEGPTARGVPTAWSATPLKEHIESPYDVVWADTRGTMEGHSLPPLYASAPQAALKDPQLYELLALVDALRAGRARERTLARKEVEKRLRP